MRIGVLGGGQLGQMLGLAGIPLGLDFCFLDPDPGACAGIAGDLITAPFEDLDACARLAEGADAITFEFENVNAGTVAALESRARVFPPPAALRVSQDRLVEKDFFRSLGIAVPHYAKACTPAEYEAALEVIGFPAVVKTRRLGYDGKGQSVVRRRVEAARVFAELGGHDLIVEQFVPFNREVSMIAVCDAAGKQAFYPLVENVHRGGILRVSRAPALGEGGAVQRQAEEAARKIAEALKYVGVFAIEFFEHQGALLANEMAPRVHNSGHWTLGAAETSQFENHLRAGLGWPLGSTAALGYAAMVNCIGTRPRIEPLLKIPGARVNLYGKPPRPGRKLGHVTLRAETREALEERLAEVIRLVEQSNTLG